MGIVIVGGGLAAGTAAVELREQGYDGDVTVFAAEPHIPYERPPLSKGFLLGADPIEKAFVKDADWYAQHDVDLRTGTAVTGVDPANHAVQVGDDSHPYDALLIATGARPRHLPLADDSGRPVHYLRTIEDSAALKDALTDGARIAIVGGGWIGLEVASAARQAGARVTIHETEELPLLRVLGPRIAQAFADLHREHGVDLRLGAAVTADDLQDADHVVVGIGAVPDTALAERAGLHVDNGILVDQHLRTSHPDIYAVGDVANHDHPVLGRRIRVEHWDTAIQQAKVAVHNMTGADEVYDRQPYFFTDQYDLGMEYVGSVGPDGADEVRIDGDLGGAFRAYWIVDGVVVAAMHANDWDASDAIKAAVGAPA